MFSERLLKLREEKKIKQSDLAESIGISRISISNYENGERTPDGEVICKLADYFDVSTDFLLGRTNIRRRYEVAKPYQTSLFELEGDNSREEQALDIIEKFHDIINFCIRNGKENALSRVGNLLNEILNFINIESDLDMQNYFDLIKVIKSRSSRIALDSLYKLRFKQKNIDACIDELYSFFAAFAYDSVDVLDEHSEDNEEEE